MTIHITPQVLRAVYKLLTEMEPFSKWNLPDADDIGFKVIKDKEHLAFFKVFARKPHLRIQVSDYNVGHTNTLLPTMAHEMIHLFMHITEQSDTNDHGETFRAHAATVCGLHGWDPKHF